MRKQRLGSNGPEISVVGFGAWEAGGSMWGAGPPDDEVIKAMRDGFDAGMTWIDTAEVYGRGKSEELVAEAVRGKDDVLIFTKLAPRPAGTGFDRVSVRDGAEASIKRLGRDVIDLYQLHWPDDNIPIEETWEAMASLVDDGLVRCIGVSNFNRSLIKRCEAIRHVDSLQPHFSMLHRKGRRNVFPGLAKAGTGVIAYGPIGFGLLTGAINRDTKFDDDDWRSGQAGIGASYKELFAPGAREKQLAIVEKLRPIAQREGITPAQLALAWVFRQKGVTAAIAGSRSSTHVAENAKAGSVELSVAVLEEIEKILT
jgi:aryl-alcohol dehydrogenase-like predicted oxidoreductase